MADVAQRQVLKAAAMVAQVAVAIVVQVLTDIKSKAATAVMGYYGTVVIMQAAAAVQPMPVTPLMKKGMAATAVAAMGNITDPVDRLLMQQLQVQQIPEVEEEELVGIIFHITCQVPVVVGS